MPKYLTEFIGTFFLVLTIGFTVIAPGAGDMAPLAIGASLMVMIFAGGYISGAHYNPAVTLAVYLRGRCPAIDIIPYWIVQILGASAAALIVMYVKGYPFVTTMQPDVTRVMIVEFLYTFALCYVVLNVATAKGTSGNPTYGIAIGFTVLAGAYAVGPVSGGAFNPAVAVGITIMGLSAVSKLWIYVIANLLGGAAAAMVFRLVNPEDR
jgi:aquaporin Z